MNFIKQYFQFQEHNATFKGEIYGGLTTFFTMAYTLFVIPNMLANTGMPEGSVFTATALAAIVGTLIMGIIGRFPMALAPGMGLNAFFTFSVCLGMNIPWQTALAGVLVSGLIFFALSISGIREKIINCIPTDLKFAVTAGIGLFIAFIGLQSAGIIVDDGATLVALGDFTDPTVLLALFGLVMMGLFMARGFNIAIFLGMVATIAAGMMFGLIDAPSAILSIPPSVAPTFGAAIHGLKDVFTPEMALVIFTFLFMDFFDTAGTIVAVGEKAGLISKDGEVKGSSRALLADSLATIAGAIFGTTNATSYIESLSGISVGARTGFSSVIVAGMFGVAMFFSPLLSVITSSVTAPALIIVGVLMSTSLSKINWNNIEIAIPAFLTIIFMPLSYSIAEGIAIGFVSFVLMMVFKGKSKQVHPIMLGLFVLFLAYFGLSA